MTERSDIRALLLFLGVWSMVCVVAFLFAARFFTAWDGHAVSVREPASSDPRVYTVLIVEGDGSYRQAEWSAEVVRGLALPVDPLAIPPTQIAEDRPRTTKSRYQLHFLLQRPGAEGRWQSVPTTTPQALGLAVLLLLIGLGVRNMAWAGSPFSIVRRDALLPQGLSASGAPAAGKRRSKQGPPPPKKRRGKRQ